MLIFFFILLCAVLHASSCHRLHSLLLEYFHDVCFIQKTMSFVCTFLQLRVYHVPSTLCIVARQQVSTTLEEAQEPFLRNVPHSPQE